MTGAAGHADAEGRFDRSVEQAVGAGVAAAILPSHEIAIRVPARKRSIEPAPFLWIKVGIRKFAQPQRAGGSSKSQIAWILPLINSAMRRRSVERCILEIAGWISVVGFADRPKERVVTRAILESVGLFEAFGRTIRRSRSAAIRIRNSAPTLKQIRFVRSA